MSRFVAFASSRRKSDRWIFRYYRRSILISFVFLKLLRRRLQTRLDNGAKVSNFASDDSHVRLIRINVDNLQWF